MAFTYSKLAEVTVGSGGASTIDFTNIPQNYTDLVVKCSTRDTGNNAGRSYVYLQFNGNTGANYTYKWIAGYDSNQTLSTGGTGSVQTLVGVTADVGATSSTFGNYEIYIPNYTSSTAKSLSADAVSENNSSSSWMNLMSASLWSITSVINRITLNAGTTSFAQYSTATLYGVKAEV